jgi:hypothetical protein
LDRQRRCGGPGGLDEGGPSQPGRALQRASPALTLRGLIATIISKANPPATCMAKPFNSPDSLLTNCLICAIVWWANCEGNTLALYIVRRGSPCVSGRAFWWIGAELIRGPVRYPGREGGIGIGEPHLEEVLWELRDQEVILIIARLLPTQEAPTVGGLCRIPYEGGQCATCKAEREQARGQR